MMAGIFIGDRQWLMPSLTIGVLGIALTSWLLRRHLKSLRLSTLLRTIGWLLIVACLVNPLKTITSPRPGSNVFAVITDVSRSQTVTSASGTSRAEQLTGSLNQGENKDRNGWLNRIAQDFELQRFTVGDQLRRTDSFENLEFTDNGSNLNSTLSQLNRRFDGQPLAGTLLLSDGNATDEAVDQFQATAPVFPVIVDSESDSPELALGQIAVAQTAFDDAPITIAVETTGENLTGLKRRIQLFDSDNKLLETSTTDQSESGPIRFQVRPDKSGAVFYSVVASLLNADGETEVEEPTVANNKRLVAVDRGSRKRRVLYLSGRPNWEYKFLRRAIETDPQTNLVGLIRIAKREAKFDFRGRDGESSNALFRGFDKTEQELAEDFDEPVLVRLGTENELELDGGFPESPEELFEYDALIIDDLEAPFFTTDQQLLIQEFVSKRGGGLLMMAGQESFRQGEYDRTPIGELLPIDLQKSTVAPRGSVRFELTRDGWLQPWIRLRPEQALEEQRLGQMPTFVTINATDSFRPGAIVMANVTDSQGIQYPALVTQRYGRGRSAALCVGDFWRWRMNEGRRQLSQSQMDPASEEATMVTPGATPSEDLNDHARACRQMIRWLVADVPQRFSIDAEPASESPLGTYRLTADLKNKAFESLEDAAVTFVITDPNGKETTLAAEPSARTIGRFEATYRCEQSGAFQYEARALCSDSERDTEELTASSGWAFQPEQVELRSVRNQTDYLTRLAETSGGRVLKLDELDDFVNGLKDQETPIQDTRTEPFWQRWWIFALAAGCFVFDWTSRRRLGLP